MKNILISLLILLFCSPSYAEPIAHSIQGITPQALIDVQFVPQQNGNHIFETKILNPSGDTILHVLKDTGNGTWEQVPNGRNDDCSTSGLSCPSLGGQNSFFRSKLQVNLSTSETYRIIVIPFNTHTGQQGTVFFGTAELIHTSPSPGSTTSILNITNQSFEGFVLNVNFPFESHFDPNNTYTYQTASYPADFFPTVMYGIECNTGNMIKRNILGGVGPNSKITASNLCKVILAPQSIPDAIVGKKVQFYINDQFRDQDGDGLGLNLEEAIGSCDRYDQNSYCSSKTNNIFRIHNLQDTDGDGLFDQHETLGRAFLDTTTTPSQITPVDLPRFGSNPSFKDMFFQLYSTTDAGSDPITEQDMLWLQNKFSLAPIDHVNANPIQVHFDIGKNPSPNSSNYETLRSLYGQWGGSAIIPQEDNTNRGAYQNGSFAANLIAEARKGIFRKMTLTRTVPGNTNCLGLAAKPSDHVYLRRPGTSGCMNVLLHEIGHSLNIGHGGHPRWGGNFNDGGIHTEINSKPMYRSIMNYAFTTTNFFTNSDPVGVINPTNVDENLGVGPTVDPSYLWPARFLLLTQNPYSGPPPYGVDWNRSGSTFDQNIRSPINTSTRQSSFALVNRQSLQTGTSEITSIKLLYFEPATGGFPRLYAFFVRGGNIFYITGIVDNAPNSNSSCPGGDIVAHMNANFQNISSSQCMTWSNEFGPVDVGANNDVVQHITAVMVRQTSYPNQLLQNSIMIAFTTTNNALFTQFSFDINPTDQTNQNTTLQAGQIQWSGVQHPVATNVRGQAEFTFTGFNATGIPNELSLFYVSDSNGNRLFQKRILTSTPPPNPAWVWGASQNLVDKFLQQNIAGSMSPRLLWWPSIEHTQKQLCGVFTELSAAPPEQIRIYCLDSTTNEWENISGKAFGQEGGPLTHSKVAFIYRHYKNPNGTPVDPVTGIGQFWLLYGENTDLDPNLLISKELNTSNTPGSFTANFPFFSTNTALAYLQWAPPRAGTFVSWVENNKISSTKGLVAAGLEDPPVTGSGNILTFMPFADGTFNADVTAGSDFKIMNRGICLGIHSSSQRDTICGPIQTSRWGL